MTRILTSLIALHMTFVLRKPVFPGASEHSRHKPEPAQKLKLGGGLKVWFKKAEIVNNKVDDQTVRMSGLVCNFVHR